MERAQPVLEELGFTVEGTYLLKPEPLPIYAMCLRSANGESIADVSLIGDQCAYSFSSFLENGHVLESAHCESPSDVDKINESGLFTANMNSIDLEREAIDESFRNHLRRLDELQHAVWLRNDPR